MTGLRYGVVDRRRRRRRLMSGASITVSCLRCAGALNRCPSCSGRFAYPKVCETCRVGLVCPSCERRWSTRPA